MRLHPDYNLALRLAGLLFQILFIVTPLGLGILWPASLFYDAAPIQHGFTLLIEWSLSMGAIALLCLLIGSLWDSLQ